MLAIVCRSHDVCKKNPLAPVIGKLGLPLYQTNDYNSMLCYYDLERHVQAMPIEFELEFCISLVRLYGVLKNFPN